MCLVQCHDKAKVKEQDYSKEKKNTKGDSLYNILTCARGE